MSLLRRDRLIVLPQAVGVGDPATLFQLARVGGRRGPFGGLLRRFAGAQRVDFFGQRHQELRRLGLRRLRQILVDARGDHQDLFEPVERRERLDADLLEIGATVELHHFANG
jgi:hypothetical protein